MAQRTFTTEDGRTIPFEGPVDYYCKGHKEPAIRSRVYVDYFRMDNEEDRKRLGDIMTKVRNEVYQAIQNPLYSTGPDGTTTVSMIFEYVYSCDPTYEVTPTEEVELYQGKEDDRDQTENEESEQDTEEVAEENKTLSGVPSDSLSSQPVPGRPEINHESETTKSEEDQEYEDQ